MGVKLAVHKDGERITEVEATQELLIGRSEDCDIVLDDRAVSRKHAILKLVDEGVRVENKSSFGPFVVEGSEKTSAIVQKGSSFKIGPFDIEVVATGMTNADLGVTPTPTSDFEPLDLEQNTPAVEESVPSETIDEVGELSVPQEGEDISGSSGESIDIGNDSLGIDEESMDMDSKIEIEGPSRLEVEGDSEQEIDSPLDSSVEDDFQFEQEDFDSGEEEEFSGSMMDGATSSQTRVLDTLPIRATLEFAPGQANVESYEIREPEVYIGRSKKCEIVISDKKSSRRHAVVKRSGASFVIEDLQSANGVYVNGVRIDRHELASGDSIRIGDSEFEFRATSVDYEKRENRFLSVPSEVTASMVAQAGEMTNPLMNYQGAQYPANGAPPSVESGMNTLAGMDVNAAQGAAAGPTDNSLLGKWKALPQRKRIFYIVAVGLLVYLFADELGPSKPKVVTKKPQKTSDVAKVKTFQSLSPEEKAFVENQYQLGLRLFQSKDFQKSLLELEKIFQIIPDYKDAKQIRRYAQVGVERLKNIEETERRKKLEQERIARVKVLETEIKKFMSDKNYFEAEKLFPEVLQLDPENKLIASFQQEIKDFAEEQRRKEIERQQIALINENGRAVYEKGVVLRDEGKCIEAIAQFKRMKEIAVTDEDLIARNQQGIDDCRASIRSTLDPVLAEAKQLEESGETAKAFKLYKQASEIDPNDPTGPEGMARIREQLNQRSKVIYTEAVIAESFSDFGLAIEKYNEVLEVAPEDDVYYGRAKSKLNRYRGFSGTFNKNSSGEGGSPF